MRTFILTFQGPLYASTSCVSSDHRRIDLMHSRSGRAGLFRAFLFEIVDSETTSVMVIARGIVGQRLVEMGIVGYPPGIVGVLAEFT
ncbi:hypothetical protein ABH922_005130 [Rhodococcus sp. 27YEA15]